MPAGLWESDPAGESGESESESETWDMELAVPAGLQGASGAWSCSELMFNIWELWMDLAQSGVNLLGVRAKSGAAEPIQGQQNRQSTAPKVGYSPMQSSPCAPKSRLAGEDSGWMVVGTVWA